MDEDEKNFFLKHDPQIQKIEVDGALFVKAEWEGFGENMPPARSETIMTRAQSDKNRNYYTKQEQYGLLTESNRLDQNDPRNELVIKALKNMKNDYLDRLLAQDAKYQLHDITSFRQQLIKARQSDPDYAQITIPQLTAELVNGDICKYYLEWLENVHRQETYKQYIAAKQQTEQNLMDNTNQ